MLILSAAAQALSDGLTFNMTGIAPGGEGLYSAYVDAQAAYNSSLTFSFASGSAPSGVAGAGAGTGAGTLGLLPFAGVVAGTAAIGGGSLYYLKTVTDSDYNAAAFTDNPVRMNYPYLQRLKNRNYNDPLKASVALDLARQNGHPGQPDANDIIRASRLVDDYRHNGTATQHTPGDPNDLSGPAGYGDAHFVTAGQMFAYEIEYENMSSADAPAQVVTVTQQLDANLNWSTFQLGNFGFGGQTFVVPAGLTSYSTRIDATLTVGVYVDVDVNFDILTGQLNWTFRSIDPATGDLPEDILTGFLPPNVTPPQGDAFLDYTVQPEANLATGTVIHAQATVIFDAGLSDQSSLDTPMFSNTIDSGSPISSMNPLPSRSNVSFPVTWSGSDDIGGSGIGTLDVFVSDNGGPYAAILSSTSLASTKFTGLPGHKYRFYTVGIDNVGHRETAPTIPGATTAVPLTITAPVSATTNQRPTITWSPLPGATSYELWLSNLSTGVSPFLLAKPTGTTYIPSDTLGIGEFRVWVRAKFSSGTFSDWSFGHDFGVTTAATLKTVNPVQTTLRPTIRWNALPGAHHYDIWFSNLSTGTGAVIRDTNVTSTTFTVLSNLPIGNFRVWVRGIAADGYAGSWSTFSAFSISVAPTITSGSDTLFDLVPTIKWNALPGADHYDIWINNLTTGASHVVRDTNWNSTTFTDSTAWAIGDYRFWVRGIAADGYESAWSSPINFTINRAPTVTRGQNSTFDRTPTFAWNPLNGAAKYEFYLRNLDTGVTVLDIKNTATQSFTPSSNLADGKYRWWVRGVTSEAFTSIWTSPIDINVDGRTDILTPVGLTRDTTPKFTWKPVDGVGHYDLWVNLVGSSYQIIRQNALTTTSFTPTTTLASGTYRAWIRAISTTGETSLWSVPVEFNVAETSKMNQRLLALPDILSFADSAWCELPISVVRNFDSPVRVESRQTESRSLHNASLATESIPSAEISSGNDAESRRIAPSSPLVSSAENEDFNAFDTPMFWWTQRFGGAI